MLQEIVTGLCAALCTAELKSRLLDHFTFFRERGGEPLSNIAGLVLDKLPEPCGNMSLCDVNVIPGGHRRRAMPHQAGQGDAVHTRLCCAVS